MADASEVSGERTLTTTDSATVTQITIGPDAIDFPDESDASADRSRRDEEGSQCTTDLVEPEDPEVAAERQRRHGIMIESRLAEAEALRAARDRVEAERPLQETTAEDARVDETFRVVLPDEATLARQRAWFARNAVEVSDAYARQIGVDAATVRTAERWYDADPNEIVAALSSGRIGMAEVEWIYERANARPDNGAKFELLGNVGPMPERPPAQRRRD